jgi:dTDP-glucose 4,6-dehydratase
VKISNQTNRGSFLESDLDEVINITESFEHLRGSKILILGGTGFVGTWLVSTLLYANEKLSLDLSLSIVTRSLKAAKKKLLLIGNDPVTFIEADLGSLKYLNENPFDFFIHAATPSLVSTGSADSKMVSIATLGGANAIIANIMKFRNNPTVLHTSSGAVYGVQLNPEMRQLEGPAKTFSDLTSDYAKVKLETETLFNKINESHTGKAVNPRLFAFAGPRIELNEHFAIGNFIRDGMAGNKITIRGNPKTIRSYLYPTDLTSWLISLMGNPTRLDLNIGSEIGYSMGELASLVSDLTCRKGVVFENQDIQPSVYVPSTKNTREILNVKQQVSLEDGLKKWIKWLELTKK